MPNMPFGYLYGKRITIGRKREKKNSIQNGEDKRRQLTEQTKNDRIINNNQKAAG